MPAPRHVRVVVELELDAEPIRGRIGEPALDFEGWLDLARALEAARGGAASVTAQPQSTPPISEESRK
ncbi:MAG: hypothetical protein WD844_06200 [Thermoleophilaceae bacterium]